MRNKGFVITLIVICSIFVVALLFLMIVLLNGTFKFPGFHGSTKTSKHLIMDEVYDKVPDKVKVEAGISDVSFKTSIDSTIRVVVYGEKRDLKVANSDSELSIKFKEKQCHFFCINTVKNKIDVYLPKDYAYKIDVSSNYGDINIGDFSKANMNIHADCGDITIVRGNIVKVTNRYGDIEVGEASSLDIKEDCGDVEIGKVNDIVVKNSYGDISIDQVFNYLDVRDDCGNIEIERLVLNRDSIIQNSFGDIDIGFTNEIYIDAKTNLGDVDVNHNYRMSNITLKIKNDCGDIEVDN